MTTNSQRSLGAADCDVAFDNLTRQLYATDASIYQIEPAAVAFPRSAQQASSIIRAAADANISITPRGAGSGSSVVAIRLCPSFSLNHPTPCSWRIIAR